MSAPYDRDEVTERVREIIAEKVRRPAAEIGIKASFVRDLNLDSLTIVELVIAMEGVFDIEIPDDEADKLRTVQDAVDYITAALS